MAGKGDEHISLARQARSQEEWGISPVCIDIILPKYDGCRPGFTTSVTTK